MKNYQRRNWINMAAEEVYNLSRFTKINRGWYTLRNAWYSSTGTASCRYMPVKAGQRLKITQGDMTGRYRWTNVVQSGTPFNPDVYFNLSPGQTRTIIVPDNIAYLIWMEKEGSEGYRTPKRIARLVAYG